MTHAVASNSRSLMLVSHAEDCVESVCIVVKWVIDHQGGMHLEHQWKVCPLTMLVDAVLIRGLNFQPCLFTCCPPHPSWWCVQLPCEFPHPGCCVGPEECLLGLVVSEQGLVMKQALFGHLFAQCPFYHRGYRCCYSFLVDKRWAGPFGSTG